VNFKLIFKLLGLVIIFIGFSMLFSCFWGIHYGEKEATLSLLHSLTISLIIGGILVLLGWKSTPASASSSGGSPLYRREALAIVSLSWLATAAVAALPFYLSGTLPSYVDAFFEAMSGLTTTGSTVLTNIEAVPKCILFWRSFTHWLGGMGIIVLFIAVLPFLGVGGRQLFKSEFSGPTPQMLRPKIRDTASILWKIYLGISIVETLLLLAGGMNLFDSLCHTFGSIATGGFSPKAASIGHYNSLYIELVIILFMILGATNFYLYFQFIRGRRKVFFKDPEWQVFIVLLLIFTLLMSINLFSQNIYSDFKSALRHGSFQVVSIMTCTGLTTADFDQWSSFAKLLLVLMMFIGGCAGSTAGGIKVIRVSILFKCILKVIEKVINPKKIRRVSVGNVLISDDLQKATLGFFSVYLIIFATAALIMTLMGLDMISALSSVATTLNMTGPGLAKVGPVRNFAFIPAGGKLLLSLCMVTGRLELFTFLALFTPYLWRRR